MNDIILRGKRYTVHQFIGTVMAAGKQLETRVQGGTVSGSDGRNVQIASTTLTHDDVFLRNDQGQEHVVRLVGWDIACREGNELQAIWLIPEGKSAGGYVLIHNRATRTSAFGEGELNNLLGRVSGTGTGIASLYGLIAFGGWLVTLIAVGVLFDIRSSWIASLGGIAAAAWFWMRQSKAASAIADTKAKLSTLLKLA